MKERPILFSGPMVRAILDGRKTQARRPVKPHHLRGSEQPGEVLNILGRRMLKEASLLCPLGQPGDRLWVRETWRGDALGTAVEYRATTSALMEYIAPWRPSIHMPRWASRITLEIARVSVERVQDMTEEDAMKEGCIRELKPDGSVGWGAGLVEARDAFRDTWQSIYGTWDANPFVWAVEFRRTK